MLTNNHQQIIIYISITPLSDHCPACHSITNSLSADSCSWDLIDVTLADEGANSIFFDDIAVADSWNRLVESFLTAWRHSDDFKKKKLEIACYYLNSWLKQKHFNPHVRCAFGIFSVRVSPLYWRRSNIWNWSWLQRRHDKSKDYFWSNWSTKKYKSSGTDNTWGWTRLISLIILTWTHFSIGSGGELVNCGGHSATSCGVCPEGNGYSD